jgi:hypothetical protein
MINSLKQMLLKKQSKDKEIKEFELDVDKYLNQEDIYNIIKGSIKNNFRFMRYYKDFQINFVPIQYWGFSGRDDSYEVTIQAKGTTEEAPKYLKSFIREKKSSFYYKFVISELDETNITKEEIFTFLKKSIED